MKSKNFLFSFVIVFLLCFSASAREPNWHIKLKQIKPLMSFKQYVERIFAPPRIRRSFEDNGIDFVLYETSEGKFTVEYSTGKCSPKSKENLGHIDNYKVEKGIVIRIIFFPEKVEKLSNFNVKNQLIKTTDGHNPAWHYVNDKLGVDYTVQKGKVVHVEFHPSSDAENLKCK